MTIENIHLCNVSSITWDKPLSWSFQGLSQLLLLQGPGGGSVAENLLTSEQLPVALFLHPSPPPSLYHWIYLSHLRTPVLLLFPTAGRACRLLWVRSVPSIACLWGLVASRGGEGSGPCHGARAARS